MYNILILLFALASVYVYNSSDFLPFYIIAQLTNFEYFSYHLIEY